MELVWGLFISSLPTRSASKAWSSRGDQQNAHRQILQQLETLRKEKADAKGEYPPNPPLKMYWYARLFAKKAINEISYQENQP